MLQPLTIQRASHNFLLPGIPGLHMFQGSTFAGTESIDRVLATQHGQLLGNNMYS